jgi:hypothetical protein
MKNYITLLLIPFFYLTTSAQSDYLETFDFNPASPTSFYNHIGWATFVHSRNNQYYLDSTIAQHGPACEPPVVFNNETYDTIHHVQQFEDAVYSCKNHLMTAIRADGYGLVNLVPNQMLDLSLGSATVKVDVSTWDHAGAARDWWTIHLVPLEDFNPLTAPEWAADLEGRSKNSLWIETNYPGNGRVFSVSMTDGNFNEVGLPISEWTSLEQVITPSKVTRSTFELHLTNDHVKFGMKLPPDSLGNEDYIWWVDTGVDDDGNAIQIPWQKSVVMLGHYSYNPRKNGQGLENTWHWDNLSISPASPFQMISTNRRFANAANPTATFSAPAASNSMMFFSVPDLIRCADSLRVSFDNGITWQQPARCLSSGYDSADHWGVSYAPMKLPVPQGATSVSFEGADNTWQQWMARDIFIVQSDILLGIEDQQQNNTINLIAKKEIQVFPNPASNQFSVQFPKKVGQQIQLSLVNLLGQKIQTLYSGISQKTGYFSGVFDRPDFAQNGTYFLQIQVDQNTYQMKLILLE